MSLDKTIEADETLESLIFDYYLINENIKQNELRRDELKEKIINRIGDASKVHSRVGVVSYAESKPTLGTLVTPDMVGQYIGARRGFKSFKFTRS